VGKRRGRRGSFLSRKKKRGQTLLRSKGGDSLRGKEGGEGGGSASAPLRKRAKKARPTAEFREGLMSPEEKMRKKANRRKRGSTPSNFPWRW